MTSSPAPSSRLDRFGDLIVGGSLAIFPLLPAGPTYLDLRWPWALEAFLLLALLVGIATISPRRVSAPGALQRREVSIQLVRRGYFTWLVPVVAGVVIGVLERNPADLTLLRVEATDLFQRLSQPMHQVADPLYPVRVGLTYLEGGVAFWLLSAALVRTASPARRINVAMSGCLVGMALVSATAIFQYITRANLLAYWVRANPGLTRSHATLDDPNALASFLVLGVGLAAGAAWSSGIDGRFWRRRIGPIVALAIALIALVATVSRAGLAAMVVASLVCAAALPVAVFANPARARRLRAVARGTCAVLIAVLVLWTAALLILPKRSPSDLPETPGEALLQTVDPRSSLDTILKGRLRLWRAALDFAKEEWVFGIGVGQFPRMYSAYPLADGPENTHNYFLQVLAEMGIVGMAGLATLLLAIALALGFRDRTRAARADRLSICLSVGVLAFVLTWLTGHPMLNLSNQLWLASVLAVGLRARALFSEGRE